jgi:transposase
VSSEGRQRRFYPAEEKRRMLEQTLEVGASVAKVAQANGVNPNVLFLWRRQHREGRLAVQEDSSRLLPVTVMDAPKQSQSDAGEPASPGSLHIELPKGRIWIEGRIEANLAGDPDAVIDLPGGTRIWIAAGVTDMRRGFDRLSAQVQTVLEQAALPRACFYLPRSQGRHRQAALVRWSGAVSVLEAAGARPLCMAANGETNTARKPINTGCGLLSVSPSASSFLRR